VSEGRKGRMRGRGSGGKASEASTDAGPEGNGRVGNGGGCVGHPRGGDVRPAREYSGSRYRSGMLGKAAVY